MYCHTANSFHQQNIILLVNCIVLDWLSQPIHIQRCCIRTSQRFWYHNSGGKFVRLADIAIAFQQRAKLLL